jgi:hypothetical protein
MVLAASILFTSFRADGPQRIPAKSRATILGILNFEQIRIT